MGDQLSVKARLVQLTISRGSDTLLIEVSLYHKIARKFYDSLLLFWARNGNEKNLPIVYVLIIEHPILDKKLRRQLKLKIEKQLPFRLEDPLIEKQVISAFEVMDLKEWKEHFPQVIISAVE